MMVRQSSLESRCENHNARGFYVIGSLNLLHGASHIIQAIQSAYLTSASMMHSHTPAEHDVLEEIMHNPYAGIFWAGIGIASLYLGYRDSHQHKKQDEELNRLKSELDRYRNNQKTGD